MQCLEISDAVRPPIWVVRRESVNKIFRYSHGFFFVGGELGLSYWGRNVGWECWRKGCWDRRLVATGTR